MRDGESAGRPRWTALLLCVLPWTACADVVHGQDAGGAMVDGSHAGDGPDASRGLLEWHFGRATALVGIHVSGERHSSPRLSRDGLGLYFVAASAGPSRLYVATRPSTSDRFGQPSLVAGEDLAGYEVASLALSPDDLEMFVQARPIADPPGTYDIYRATRQDIAGAWQLAREDELVTAGVDDAEPFLSADGLEIVFTSPGPDGPAIHSARRYSLGMQFAPPVRIDLGVSADDHGPTLSRDGRRLLFGRRLSDTDVRTFAAVRSSSDTLEYGEPIEVSELNVAEALTDQVFVAESTGEAFLRSNRPWSPASQAIWIAQLCEGAPCDEPEVLCPEGMMSPDRRHCYWLEPVSLEGPAGWQGAQERCADKGAYLASVHSDAEYGLTTTLVQGDTWFGATDLASECNVTIPGCTYAWVSGEPFLYSHWGANEPNDSAGVEDCMMYFGAIQSLNDFDCINPLPGVCERELWPLW